MATTIHLPPELLKALDRRARALKLSRNRLIVRAVERELAQGSEWSPGFFDKLTRVTPEEEAAVDEMLQAIRTTRRSKGPPDLDRAP